MKLYMGFDGGGTKTKGILCDEQGHILAEDIQPTCHYLQCGFDGVQKVFEDGCTALLQKAKHSKQDIQAVFAACAGYGDIEKDNPLIEARVQAVFPNTKVLVGNDTDNALAGALAGECGINIIAGTGSIALGKSQDGKQMRCGGWHHIFGGDEGSAYWIACKLIAHFTKQADGREPRTQLYSFLKKKYEFHDDSDILEKFIVDWGFDRTRIASLSTNVAELAQLHDEVAIAIFDEAAKELATIILPIAQTLNFSGTIPVSYTGGVFKSGSFVLDPLKKYLKVNPNIFLKEPILSPDAGSIILAMQADGIKISDEIIRQLKG